MRKRYSKNSKDCSVCKAEFDSWINDNHYESDQEKEVRNHFYNYCHVCEPAHRKRKEH